MDNTTFVVIAIVAALGLVGLVAITVVTIPTQQAEAAGCKFSTPDAPFGSIPFNASQGRCFGHGP